VLLQSLIEDVNIRIAGFSENIPAPEFVVPLVLVIGVTLIGFLLERLLLKGFVKTLSPTIWRHLDDVLIDSLRWIITFWFFLGGLYLALYSGSLGQRAFEVLSNALVTVLVVAFVLSLGWVINRVVRNFIRIYTSQVHGLPSSSVLMNAATIVILTIAGLLALQSVGISVTPILTALGVGGLAVALALQETLANFFSGIAIIVSRQLKPGDYVKLEGGDEGYVHDITWRNTTIQSLMNNMIIVPNSTLSSTIITNYHQPNKQMGVIVEAGVSYDSDLSRVEEVTLEVASEVLKEVEGGVPDYEPLVRYNTFGESSVGFSVILRTREATDQYLATHEFMKRLHGRYEKEGIEIPFPIRTIHMKDSPDGRGEREGGAQE
jgi:small-conductance mechanosensitive channel